MADRKIDALRATQRFQGAIQLQRIKRPDMMFSGAIHRRSAIAPTTFWLPNTTAMRGSSSLWSLRSHQNTVEVFLRLRDSKQLTRNVRAFHDSDPKIVRFQSG